MNALYIIELTLSNREAGVAHVDLSYTKFQRFARSVPRSGFITRSLLIKCQKVVGPILPYCIIIEKPGEDPLPLSFLMTDAIMAPEWGRPERQHLPGGGEDTPHESGQGQARRPGVASRV